MQKTKQEIIDESIAHYKTNPRGIGRDSANLPICVYLNPDNGAMCAAGRCMANPKAEYRGSVCYLFADTGNPTVQVDLLKFEELLKPEYQGHQLEFWSDLQTLHDESINWKPNSRGGNDLTSEGYENVARLENKWCQS